MRTLQQANSHPTPGVSIPDRNWSEKATHVRASSTTSICSTASSLPNSVLRKGKYDTSLNEILTHPLGQLIDVNIIYRTYGKTVSLYNILCIEPSADYDTIRRAYLKQGRKALLGHDEAHRNDNAKVVTPEAAFQRLEDISPDARKKFQAITIAHEILSTPDLRHAYDIQEHADKSATAGHRRVKSGNSVRWNHFVQEKIIQDFHPDEHSHRKKTSEGGWLHMNLQRLDREAEMFLSSNFLDEIDESISSISESLQESIGSFMKKSGAGVQGYTVQALKVSQSLHRTPPLTSEKQHNSALQNSNLINVRTQFSEEVPNESNTPANIFVSLESPCSVIGCREFLSDVVDETTSALSERFSCILDLTRNDKLEFAKPNPITASKQTRLEKKRLDKKSVKSFGEPFYVPPFLEDSDSKESTRMEH